MSSHWLKKVNMRLRWQGISLLLMLMLVAVGPVLAELKDPTRPPVAKAPVIVTEPVRTTLPGPRLRLKSTLIGPGRSTAVINNRVVQKGDRFGSSVVVDIQPTSVRLRRGQREYDLKMLAKKVKKPSQRTRSGEP